MVKRNDLKKEGVFLAKVIGEQGTCKVKIRSVFENTAVVELIDYENKPAVVKLSEIHEAIL